MTVEARQAASCGGCRFWSAVNPREGACRRAAPWPTDDGGHTAHWPTTRASERCGEFSPDADDVPAMTPCARCQYWHTNPDGGLNPTDRNDKRMAWWRQAGLCVRRSPGPSSTPGNRAFWRATHMTDFCAEGVATGTDSSGS